MDERKLTFEEIKSNNQLLRNQLTKKNEQYMLQLDRSLVAANFNEEQREQLYHEMLTELVAKQKTGLTARQIYGTVTERVSEILNEKVNKHQTKSPDWHIALDGGLLMGGLFSLMSGVTMYLNPSQTASMGLITLLLNFIVGGLVLLLLSKFAPDFSKPKGETGYWKYLGVSLVSLVVWLVLVMAFQTLLPNSINISMPFIVYILIGTIAIGLKWYLKKILGIKGTIM